MPFHQRYLLSGIIRAEDGAKPVAIVDIIVIEVGTGVIAGYPRIVVVVLLRKQLSRHFVFHQPIFAEA